MNKRKLFIIFSISYFLIACGVSPKQQQVKGPDIVTPSEIDLRAPEQKLLDFIEAKYAQNNNISERNLSLLNLADYYRSINNCSAANIVVASTLSTLDSRAQVGFANLLKAECALIALDGSSDLSNNSALLTAVEKWVNTAKLNNTPSSILQSTLLTASLTDLRTRTEIVSAQLMSQNRQFKTALEQLLNINIVEKLGEHPKYVTYLYDNAWQWFSSANETQQMQLANTYPLMSDYKMLFDTIQNRNIDDNGRQASITAWLSNSTNKTLTDYLPTQIQNYLAINHIKNKNIAVLLPLSGRLSAQGEAIKQGILSAYYAKLADATQTPQSSIEFIDTGSVSALSLAITAESLAPFDTIIGPLLRSHIDEVNNLNLQGKHQLVLNQATFEGSVNNNLLASFALAPEQEAQQLVTLMRARDIINPIVIDDGSGTSQRMKAAFTKAWETSSLSHTSKAVPLQYIHYSDNKSMRLGITSALNVLQSENRIKQLSNLNADTVHSVTRNRRDIDAFAIFARPNDLGLINPIIESSISLFTTEHIPVFASSYGYDHKQSKNSQRDLRNLVFLDMPWLLPPRRDDALSTSVDTLFNKPPSSYLRLFAFGHDSIAVIDNLAQLTTFAHVSVTGLTGNLSIDDTRQLTRELSWISINDGSLE